MRPFYRSLLLLVLLPLGGLFADAPPAPARSAQTFQRSIWITRWDFQNAEDVDRAVRWCGALGFDRVFLQVRGEADAYYHSRMEPRAERLRRTPDFDPLSVALEAGQRSGVSVHAWLNLVPAWKGVAPPKNTQHVVHQHPEWFMTDRAGARHLGGKGGHYAILNPCLPEVRTYLASVVQDLTARYPVDGVHFDYVRFAGRGPGKLADFPYDPRTLRLFRQYAGVSPFDDAAAWDRWRRLSVNTLLYRVAQTVRETRPSAHVSVAVLPDLERARTLFFQDTESWCAKGWIDEIIPMAYRRDTDTFGRQVQEAVRKSHGVPVSAGIGVHLFEAPRRLTAQITLAERFGAASYSLFAFSNFFPSPSHESKRDPRSVALRKALRNILLADLTTPAPSLKDTSAITPAHTNESYAGAAARAIYRGQQ